MTYNKCVEKKESDWLIMVYLAGDNNLSANSIAFLQELEAAEHNRNVRVVAGFDSTTPWPKGARYLEIKRHIYSSSPYKKLKWSLHNDLVQPGHIVVTPDFCNTIKGVKPPDEPTAEEALARFLDWVRKYYTARKYVLILFGHGTLVAGNTFLSDTNPPSYLKLGAFSRILREHFRQKIDILACDNCVMNGIESAVQLWKQVNYMVGSQGLMLANAWPVREIIEAIGKHYTYHPKDVAEKVLRVCARNVLDFALMERSSEQAICDVTKFGPHGNIVTAVRGLSAKLQEGLQFKEGTNDQELLYPLVRDVVRLARLEAQSYWNETFVDLYDFAALLLERCEEFLRLLKGMVNCLFPHVPSQLATRNITFKDFVRPWPLIERLDEIAWWCRRITHIFRHEEIVPRAYYVCPQLQYSHGISIYFPWTLPEGPITFEPVNEWEREPKNYYLKTPFEEYRTYLFAQEKYGDWARFLEAFFRATLRNVRVAEYEYLENPQGFFRKEDGKTERAAAVIDLQKSGSDTGEPDECECPSIKNYPRRFYLSPADCKRRMKVYGIDGEDPPTEKDVIRPTGRVSYLGWNIRGLLAEEIGLPPSATLEQEENSLK